MPVWTIQELLDLNSMLRTTEESRDLRRVESVVKRFLIAGGVPRTVLFAGEEEFNERIEQAIENVEPQEIFQNASRYGAQWKDFANALLHTKSEPNTFKFVGNTLATR